jgi:hypothetical protein
MITQQRLHELFEYRDGTLIWKVTRNVGKIAGTLDTSTGYWRINIDKKMYRLHRMIFLYHNGYLTDGLQVDHIDMERTNNRIENLREVTNAQNQHNTKRNATNNTGVKGVAWHKAKKKYKVTVSLNSKSIHLGYFDDLEEAKAAAIAGREKYHGTFARHD